MELGNLCFGNSRGTYHVNRDLQDIFCRGLESLGFDPYGSPFSHNLIPRGEHGQFENETFWIMPYNWGDCDCGYDEKEHKWCKSNAHRDDCYQIAFRRFEAEFNSKHGGQYKNSRNARLYEKEINLLLRRFNLPPYPNGCAVHCTCDHDDRWMEWAAENQHSEACCVVLPNFWHKPTGLKISWYKYALRDSYSNQEVDQNLLKKVFASCKASIRKQSDVQKKES